MKFHKAEGLWDTIRSSSGASRSSIARSLDILIKNNVKGLQEEERYKGTDVYAASVV